MTFRSFLTHREAVYDAKDEVESDARKLNWPVWWLNPMHYAHLRLCFAHGGGCSAFVDWHLHGQSTPGKNWALDNLLRDACPGMC